MVCFAYGTQQERRRDSAGGGLSKETREISHKNDKIIKKELDCSKPGMSNFKQVVIDFFGVKTVIDLPPPPIVVPRFKQKYW
jgi:hypothetical protein